jgi:hypothetical protein
MARGSFDGLMAVNALTLFKVAHDVRSNKKGSISRLKRRKSLLHKPFSLAIPQLRLVISALIG